MQQDENYKKEFTGVWIPKHVIEDQDLSMSAKIIYAEIACFNICYKSNESLGNRYNLKKNTISLIIKSLKDKGYVEELDFDGRKRSLKAKLDMVNQTLTSKKIKPSIRKKSTSEYEKNQHIEYIVENSKENSVFCDSDESRNTDVSSEGDLTNGYKKPKAAEKKVKTREEIEMNRNITLVIEKFKAVSPHLTYANKTERAAAQKMISEFGASETLIIIDTALATMARDKYCPKATTPNIFYKKFGDIRIYFSSINSTKSIIA